MPYYAHTATKPDGTPDPDESKWQLLADHLKNVAELALGSVDRNILSPIPKHE